MHDHADRLSGVVLTLVMHGRLAETVKRVLVLAKVIHRDDLDDHATDRKSRAIRFTVVPLPFHRVEERDE